MPGQWKMRRGFGGNEPLGKIGGDSRRHHILQISLEFRQLRSFPIDVEITVRRGKGLDVYFLRFLPGRHRRSRFHTDRGTAD